MTSCRRITATGVKRRAQTVSDELFASLAIERAKVHASLYGVAINVRGPGAALATIRTHAGVRKQLLLRASAGVDSLEASATVAHAATSVEGVVDRRGLVGIVRRIAKQAAATQHLVDAHADHSGDALDILARGWRKKWKRGLHESGSSANTPSMAMGWLWQWLFREPPNLC